MGKKTRRRNVLVTASEWREVEANDKNGFHSDLNRYDKFIEKSKKKNHFCNFI